MVSKSINWWFLAHTVPAKQRAPKLSNYYSNSYHRISDANSSIRSMFSIDGPLTNRQNTLNLGCFFPPNYGWYYYSTTWLFAVSPTKCNISFHCIIANPETLLFMQEFICVRVTIRLEKACLAQMCSKGKLSNKEFVFSQALQKCVGHHFMVQ